MTVAAAPAVAAVAAARQASTRVMANPSAAARVAWADEKRAEENAKNVKEDDAELGVVIAMILIKN